MTTHESYTFGPFVLDPRRWRLERDGQPVALQPLVLRTLHYLVRERGRVVPKDELITALWPGRVVTDDALTRCVKELRQALGDDGHGATFVRTVRRVGYAFAAEVRVVEHDAGHATQVRATLAVLPLRPLVARARDEALELGIADDLINQLSGLRQVVVRPLAAVRRYAGPQHDPLAAGAEQRADYVVEGSLHASGGRIAVSLRLLEVADGSARLAIRLDTSPAELPARLLETGRRIAEALAVELTPNIAGRLAGHGSAQPQAWRSYLLGRLRAGRHTPDADRLSIERFREAVALDPGYALAWSALADCCVSLGTLGTGDGHFEAARAHAERALALQPDLVPALTCLGTVAWLRDRDWAAAERHFQAALEAAPHHADAQVAYADFCSHMGRHEQAIAAAGHAAAIDPNSAWVQTLLAQALHMAGLHDEAVTQARQALALAPDFAFAHLFAGLSSLMNRRWDEGIAHVEQAHRQTARGDFAGALGWAYAVAGREDDARALLAMLESAGDAVPPIVRSFVHLGLGDDEQALDLIERADAAGDWHVLLLHAEPAFRRLRQHPRARHLLERLRLPG